MMVTIAPYDEECYKLRTPKGEAGQRKAITGDYEILDEDFTIDPVLAYIMEDTKEEHVRWKSTLGDRSASFRITVPADGKAYWLCIQNSSHQPHSKEEEAEHPDHYPRTVGFTYTDERQPVHQTYAASIYARSPR